jgi:SHS family lactate transporter-like MFS transporter
MFFVGAIPAIPTVLLCLQLGEPAARIANSMKPAALWKSALDNGRLFLFLILLMTAMAFISHGSQDMYPTFLSRERHFSVQLTAVVTGISTIGAICGGLIGGHLSGRLGRRRTIVYAALLAVASVPLWVGRDLRAILIGATLMQFMVQAAWGVLPAHITELSPANLRAILPGAAYQFGVVISSSIVYIEALLGERYSYTVAMGAVLVAALLLGALVVRLGPEAKDATLN